MNFFDDLYDRFHEIHTELIKAVEGLPPEALDWTPGPETNSINVLVVHLTGAERYWIGVALNNPQDRVRDEEFKAHGLSVEELKMRLTASDDHARQALTRFSLRNLRLHANPRATTEPSQLDGASCTPSNTANCTSVTSN
jgi:uncharacterized damage-inducible protein DinB